MLVTFKNAQYQNMCIGDITNDTCISEIFEKLIAIYDLPFENINDFHLIYRGKSIDKNKTFTEHKIRAELEPFFYVIFPLTDELTSKIENTKYKDVSK